MRFVDNARLTLPRVGASISDVTNFLTGDLSNLFRELFQGLRKLTFDENFQSFTVTVTIAAGAIVTIPNQAKSQGWVPTSCVILRAQGGRNIVDGDTAWTLDTVNLKNAGAVSATVTVVFLK